MNSADIEAFGGEQLQRAVLALQVDRAHFGHHHARDLLHDLVEPGLAIARLGHDLTQAPHDHTQCRFTRHDSWLVTAPLHEPLPPDGSASSAGFEFKCTAQCRAALVSVETINRMQRPDSKLGIGRIY